MTDRLQALRDLLPRVEAGDGEATFGEYYDCFDRHAFNAINSFNGSLDTAKSLHEAVLADWGYIIDSVNEVRVINPWVEGDAIYCTGFIDHNCGPARAWLIAIIKALITQEEAKCS